MADFGWGGFLDHFGALWVLFRPWWASLNTFWTILEHCPFFFGSFLTTGSTFWAILNLFANFLLQYWPKKCKIFLIPWQTDKNPIIILDSFLRNPFLTNVCQICILHTYVKCRLDILLYKYFHWNFFNSYKKISIWVALVFKVNR